jgi:hypothetical protein
MNTALVYSTRVVPEGGRRCTLNDLVHLNPLRIPLMNPPHVLVHYTIALYRNDDTLTALEVGFTQFSEFFSGQTSQICDMVFFSDMKLSKPCVSGNESNILWNMQFWGS